MTLVFVDTSAWYAIIDQTDASHPSAIKLLKRVTSARSRLVTTGHVLAELHRLILHRSDRSVAIEAVRGIVQTPRTELIHTDVGDMDAAISWIDRFNDQDFTLTDALSFAVMERLGIRRAFAFDHDFAVAGFELLTLT